jgi:dinuclear metal center YbgI/SA1388 family protein
MKASELISYLETLAPPSLQESYDNSGLIVGHQNTELTGVLISLDCTEDVVNEAIQLGCNMILSHHPIVFSGLKRFNGKNYVERTVIKAIQHNILLYAIHTNLDHVLDGVNGRIASQLGLINTRILAPKKNLLQKLVTFVPSAHAENVRNALFEAGAGAIGNYDQCSFNSTGEGSFRGNDETNAFVGEKGKLHFEPEIRIEVLLPAYSSSKIIDALKKAHPYEEVAYYLQAIENTRNEVGAGLIGELPEEVDTLEFLKSLKLTMRTGCVKYTLPHKHKVKRIAVCGGSGSFLLSNAIAANADVFITADFKYHQFFDAENSVIIADIGHYESEQFTMQFLADKLVDFFPKFATHLTRVKTNPVYYL